MSSSHLRHCRTRPGDVVEGQPVSSSSSRRGRQGSWPALMHAAFDSGNMLAAGQKGNASRSVQQSRMSSTGTGRACPSLSPSWPRSLENHAGSKRYDGFPGNFEDADPNLGAVCTMASYMRNGIIPLTIPLTVLTLRWGDAVDNAADR